MRRLAVVTLAAAVLGLMPATAQAQQWFGAFTDYTYGGAAGECPSVWHDCPNRRTGYGVVFGGLGHGGLGFEQEFAWTPDFFGKGGDVKGSKVTTLMANLLVGLPIGPLRPYGAAGIGLMRAKIDFGPENLSDFRDTSFGWDYGAGVTVLLPAHLGIRIDYRRFRSSATVPFTGDQRRDAKLEFSRASIGLVLH